MHKIFFSILIIINICFSEINFDEKLFMDSNNGERYISSSDGVIRMYVNVWGHVPAPGRILVNDGIGNSQM